MNTSNQPSNKFIPSERNAMHVVNALSFAIPVVVALLLGIPYKFDLGEWTKMLPQVIALINVLTSLVLVVGWITIRSHDIQLHRIAMLT